MTRMEGMNMDDKAIEVMARGAYIAHHKCGPGEDALYEPNMGRGGFKTEVTIWNAVAQAALAAYHAHLEAEGFAIVPVEPTTAMVLAADNQMRDPSGIVRAYRAMIAASEGEG